MSTSVTVERFTFQSDGETLVGNVFIPKKTISGIVIVTGPLTSVKEQAQGAYAKAMAERGYAALAFDYRYFGESGGQPRQFENPNANMQDISNAAAALTADERFKNLPVFGLGVCYGASAMARSAAQDKHFKAFAGVAGVYTDAQEIRQSMGAEYQKAIDRGQAAEKKWRDTGKAETIPAVAPNGGDVAMPLREAYEFYGTPRGMVPNYTNGYAVQSMAYSLPFDAQIAAKEMTVPVGIVHSETALAPAWARKFYAHVTTPKQELWLRSQGQIDFYDDPKLIKAASDFVVQVYKKATVQKS